MAILAQQQSEAVVQRELHGAKRRSAILERADGDRCGPGQFLDPRSTSLTISAFRPTPPPSTISPGSGMLMQEAASLPISAAWRETATGDPCCARPKRALAESGGAPSCGGQSLAQRSISAREPR
jgi:hypothetical protein